MNPAQRKAAIAKIHIGKKQLGLDEDTYRAVLLTRGGANSCAKLKDDGINRVLDWLRAAGAVYVNPVKARKKPRIATPAEYSRDKQLKKIEALLTDKGLSWSYLTATQSGKDGKPKPSMLKRLTGVDSLEWCKCTHLEKIIAALSIQQRRDGRKESA